MLLFFASSSIRSIGCTDGIGSSVIKAARIPEVFSEYSRAGGPGVPRLFDMSIQLNGASARSVVGSYVL